MAALAHRWAFATGLAGLTLWLASWRPLHSAELWWHLTFGRAADAARAVPSANHVTYILDADAPSFLQPWLAQWWLYRVFEAASYEGLLTLRGVVLGMAVTFAVLAATRRSSSDKTDVGLPLIWAPVGAVVVGWGGIGPGMFGAAFAALTWWTTTLRGAWRLVVIPLAAVWVNVDWTFATGALLLWAAAWESRERSAWGALVGFMGATLISPRHIHVWLELGHAMTWWQASTLIVCAMVVLPRFRGKIHPVGVAALVLVAGAVSWASVALAGLACIATAAATRKVELRRGALSVAVAFAVVAVGMLPTWQWAESLRKRFIGDAVGSEVPTAAMDIIASWGSQRRFYTSPQNAGLVTWAATAKGLYPCVFRDVRRVPAAFETLQNTVERQPGVWRGVFQQYGVEAVLLELPAQQRLATELALDDAWHVVWESPHMALITR